MVYNNNGNNNVNYYTIVDFPEDNQTYGKFKGTSPKKAGSKVFSFLFKFMNIDKNDENSFFGKFIVFVIRNIKTGKEYKYIGNRIKLENPIKIRKNNKEIEYNYKNVIGKFKPQLDLI